MRYKAIGKAGFAAAILLAVAFCIISFFFWPAHRIAGKLGLCLPSPDEWTINPVSSWIINTVLILGSGLSLAFINRIYSFVKSTDYVLPAVFIMLTASNPLLDGYLNASVIMVVVCIISLSVMFTTYKQANASREVFIVATLISIGSMFQYAFLSMVPAFIGVAAVMKCLRFRELVAFALGIIAPYWVGVGLGLIPLSAFSVPAFTNIFEGFSDKADVFLILLNIGVVSLVSLLLALNNGVVLYAGNSQIRAMNNAINIVCLTCVVCMFFDFYNIRTYFATIYMGAAVQLGNLFALFKFRRGWIVMVLTALLSTAFFIAMFVNFS